MSEECNNCGEELGSGVDCMPCLTYLWVTIDRYKKALEEIAGLNGRICRAIPIANVFEVAEQALKESGDE